MARTTSPREVWFTTTKKGTRRAWYYGYAAGRALPLALAVADMEILTGAAVWTTKPEWVGR